MPFVMPAPQIGTQSDIGIIQEHFKHALWEAFDGVTLSGRIEQAATVMQGILTRLKQHRLADSSGRATRFSRYWLKPETGEWEMRDLEPNRDLPNPPLPLQTGT